MRILYLSCHSILEYEEVKMLHELGYNVFPAGAYINPADPHDNKRPSIPGLELDPALLEQYSKLASPGVDSRDCLTKEFVDNFDTVIIMHLPRWAENNWNALKHKRVIWRTIGQSVASTEQTMAKFVNQGMQIVRYSPQEVCIPHFAGQDALIRFYKDPDQYGNWLGDKKQVITFAQNMKNRGSACNYSFFEEATRPFPRHLFGPGNEGESWTSGVVPYEQLKEELRRNRVYFYTGTHPASYTLNFMEAWMCFPEDTLVSSDTAIEDILVKDYKGDLLTITTEDNISVSCTPTHPFLTQRGFVEAQNLGLLDNIYQYQETNCEEMDRKRIRDLVEEFQKTNRRSTKVTTKQKLLGYNNEVQNHGTETSKLNYLQTSEIFYDGLRDLLLGWNNRWRRNLIFQGKQKTQEDSANSSNYQYRSNTNRLVREETLDDQSRNLEEIFTSTKRSIQFLVKGIETTESIGGIASLSLDQKRAVWNFDWFHQESFESELRSKLLSIRNRLLNQDPNIESKRIKSITRKPFQGKVYNLSTADGVYKAEGFIVHNTGIPIVAIGQQRGNAEHLYNHNLYEIPYLIQNGENGFVSDDIDELRMYINQLLKDDSLAKKISINGRNSAIRHFNKDMIAASWKEFLGE